MKRKTILPIVLSIVLVMGLSPFAYAAGSSSSSSSTATSTSSSSASSSSSSTSTASSSTSSPSASTALTAQSTASVQCNAHVQDVGWQGWTATDTENAIAGTSGQSLRMEALQLKLDLSGVSGGISYSAHVQDVGWQDAVSDGGTAGTTGRSLRIEALKINLTGDVASQYDVYYRVHVQDVGWMAWAKDGQEAGTTGMSYRIEAVQVVLVAKNGAAPASSNQAYSNASIDAPSVAYKSHVQNVGWQGWRKDGALAGTTGRSLRVEALEAEISGGSLSGGISYAAHVQDVGWQSAVSDGALAGTTGQSLRVEAVTMSLTGDLANYFDVYYRVHIQNEGWLGWAADGAVAGSVGCSLRVEAVQVVLVAKGNPAPGSTDNAQYTDVNIMGTPHKTIAQMVANYNYATSFSYPTYYKTYGGPSTITKFCTILYDEAVAEGVRPEIVYAQAMLETNYLRFGGAVSIGQYNFAGIGSTGPSVPGNSFESVRIGLRAQVQHLKAYASTEPLNKTCVDPRFNYITRGCATTVYDLSQRWATSDTYGKNILSIVNSL